MPSITYTLVLSHSSSYISSSKPFSFKPRNFDPSTRQAARRPRTLANGSVVYEEGEEEDEGVVGKKGDTVEDKVKGLAEKIVRDDERKREEELVSFHRWREFWEERADVVLFNHACSSLLVHDSLDNLSLHMRSLTYLPLIPTSASQSNSTRDHTIALPNPPICFPSNDTFFYYPFHSPHPTPSISPFPLPSIYQPIN